QIPRDAPGIVPSPANNGAVRSERQAVESLRANSYHVAQCARHTGLPVGVIAPGRNCAVGPKRQTEVIARSQSHDSAQSGGHVRLAETIAAPGHDGPIGLKRQAVILPGGDPREPQRRIACARTNIQRSRWAWLTAKR